jgi:serine/threonine-protein kinase RsbW
MASATPDVDSAVPAAPATAGALADTIEIRLPADGAYLALLRTATAGVAARMDFTLDEIEDLRIAIDEACALLLADAADRTPLQCVFTLGGDTLHVQVSVTSRSGEIPDQTSFAWTVLEALAGSVDVALVGAVVRISLHKQRGTRS